MARSLSFALDARMQLPSRRPAYKVELFDFRSTTDTLRNVVRGDTLAALTGPLDATANVSQVTVDEVAGDFVSSGVPSSAVTVTIIDDTPGGVAGRWDPQLSADDSTAPARFVRRGNGIRVYEGDQDIDDADWPITFTGTLVGQAGVSRGRGQVVSVLTFQAVSREAAYVNQIRTSDEFARLAAYRTMGDEIARNVMALDADEIDFVGWGTDTTGLPIQFIEQTPLTSIAQLMFPDGFLPRFDSTGVLSQSFGDVAKSPSRIYETFDTVHAIVRPFSNLDPVNSVEVIGLDRLKTKVNQQRQPIAEVSVTTGYFTPSEEINVYWSEDRTVLAEGVQINIQRSVNGGLSILGGGESFSLIDAPLAASGLSIGAILKLETGFAPYLIVFFAVTYVILAAIPDSVIGFGAGTTIPIGRVIQAAALVSALILMMKIGRGQYEFKGEPVEFVFKEIVAIAELEGLTSETLNRVTIENHLVQDQATADAIAAVVLFRQQARGNPRTVTMLHDLRLEPDDVFELPDLRRFLIERISRVLVRGDTPVLATLGCFEVTPGLEP